MFLCVLLPPTFLSYSFSPLCLYLILPLHLFPPSLFALPAGESHSCQIFKAAPCALFPCISMHWWVLNNIHSQQTFKRAQLASYMIGWCAVLLLLLLLGALVFRQKGSQSREVWLLHEPNSAPLWRARKCEKPSLMPSCSLALSGCLLSTLAHCFSVFYCIALHLPLSFLSLLWNWDHDCLMKAEIRNHFYKNFIK